MTDNKAHSYTKIIRKTNEIRQLMLIKLSRKLYKIHTQINNDVQIYKTHRNTHVFWFLK